RGIGMQFNPAVLGGQGAEEHREQGRLPSSVRPDDGDPIVRCDREGEVTKERLTSVTEAEFIGVENHRGGEGGVRKAEVQLVFRFQLLQYLTACQSLDATLNSRRLAGFRAVGADELLLLLPLL